MTERVQPKFRPEVKADYLVRLRSGNYGQGKGRLSDNQGNFCCLGVLCEAAVAAGVIPEADVRESGFRDNPAVYYGYRPGDGVSTLPDPGSSNYLPKAVAEWAFEGGLNTRNWDNPHVPNPSDPGYTVDLATLNDDYGFTFEQIADAIEEHM